MLRLFANFSNCRYLCELECVAARVDDMGCRSARRNVHRSSRFRISHFSESIGVQVISPHFTGALEVFHACVIPAHDPCGVSERGQVTAKGAGRCCSAGGTHEVRRDHGLRETTRASLAALASVIERGSTPVRPRGSPTALRRCCC